MDAIAKARRAGHRWTVLALALLGLLSAPALAQAAATAAAASPPAFNTAGRPRIGLVLGGGGAKGFAHIGVIEELERRHIPVDVITGTSMGAVVGSMYAIGNDATELKAVARAIDWKTIFNDSPDRNDLSFRRKREVRDILLNFRLRIDNGKPVLPTGVLGGQRLFATVQQLLSPWKAADDFDNLAIPFRAVATDIVTGKAITLGTGDLSTAVFASMSIPAAFPPVQREGLLLVDGGISNNLPVDMAREMGVDVVIVVDVGEPPAPAEKITSALSVFNQMQLLLGYDAIRRQRESLSGRDVLIEPDITGFGVTAFDRLEDGIERGRTAAQKVGDKLSGLSVNDAQWAAYLAEREARSNPAPIRIDKVVIANTSTLRDRDIAPLVTIQPGDKLDGTIMKQDVQRIYALDAFDRVDYNVDIQPAGNTLTVNAEGIRGAQKYWQAGMILTSNFGKTSDFEVALGFTDLDFLGTGAQWRGFGRVGNDILFDVSLYKQTGRFFVEPMAYYRKYSAVVTRAGTDDVLGGLQVQGGGAGIEGGMVLGNWGELRAGVRLGGVNPTEDGIAVDIPNGWQRDFSWRASFAVDTFDSLTFPRSGTQALVQYVDHDRALGGQFSRSNFNVSAQHAMSWGKNSLLVGARVNTTANARSDLLGDNLLGGFLNLSGTRTNSLIGRQLLFGRVVGYRRISEKSPILDMPLYFGGSFEVGNVWTDTGDIAFNDLRTSVSGFVAADTPLGPVWFAVGQSGSDTSIYLVLGRVF